MGHVKNSLIAIGVVAIAILTSISANASILIEPHLGYNVNSSTTWDDSTWKYTGPEYGARLGLQYLGLMGGFNYTHATYTLEATALGGSAEADWKRDEMGVFVGYKFPVLLRAWVGYNFSAKQTVTAPGTFSPGYAVGDYYKGHSTEIGVGFTGFPIISLNLSYKMFSYDKASVGGVSGTLAPKFEPKEIVIGISAPFTLL